MHDGDVVFRFFDALPALVGCVLGFYVLWASIFLRDVRFGMNRNNPPVHGLLALVARVLVAMIALYAILMGGKIALDRLLLWQSLSRRLSLIERLPIGTIVRIVLVALFSAIGIHGMTLLLRRDLDWKSRAVGSALLFGCGLIVFAIAHFGLAATT